MPENRKILLLGAGGHCKSVLDSLLNLGCYQSIGLVDNKLQRIPGEGENLNLNPLCMGSSVVGTDADLERLQAEGYTDAFVTVGSIGNVALRKKLYVLLKQKGFSVPNIIDNSAVVSPYAALGEGIYIGKNAVVNADAIIGNCAILNTATVIEHECIVMDFVHVAPGSILCGNITVEEGTHIGAKSVVKQGLNIGANTMIGMGSVVLNDIGSRTVAYGNPCKEVSYE